MIEEIKNYIAECPYLDDFIASNVNYLVDKVNAYSINENASYNPVINEDWTGNKEMQFLFSFDAKLHWNEEIKNNINNSLFFEKFKNWLEENDNKGIYPKTDLKIIPISIGAITNGYIYATNADEAIYRISCRFTYFKEGGMLKG